MYAPVFNRQRDGFTGLAAISDWKGVTANIPHHAYWARRNEFVVESAAACDRRRISHAKATPRVPPIPEPLASQKR